MFAPPRRDEVTGRVKVAKRSDTRHRHALPEYDLRHKVDHSGTKNLDSSDFARRNRSKNAKVNNVLQSITGSRALAEKNKPKFDAQKRNKAALKAAAKKNQINQVRQEEPKQIKTKKTGRVPETHRGQRPGQRPSKMPKEYAPTIHETNTEEMYAIKKGPQGYGLGDRISPHTTAYQDVGHAAVEPTLSREAQWRADVQAQIEAKRLEQRKFVATVSDEEIALAEIAQERQYQRSQQLEALQRNQALPPLHTHTHQPAAEIFPLGFSQPQPVHISEPYSQPQLQPQYQLQPSVGEPALTAQEQWKRDLDAQIAEKKARKQREKEAEAAQDSMFASSNWALGGMGMGMASNQEIRNASMSPQTQPNQLRQSPNRLGLSGSQGIMSEVDDAAKFAPRPPMQQSFDRSSGLAELTAARRAILLQQQELEAQIAEKKLRMLKEKEAEALEQMQWLAEAGAISMGAGPKMPPSNASVGDSSSIAMPLANANMDPDDPVKSGTLSPIHASPSRQHELNATLARSGSISLGGATGRTPTSSAKVKQQDSHKEFLRQQMEEAVAAKKRKAEEARLADLADDERAKREAAELAAQFERDQMKAAEDKQRKLDEENELREARLAAAAEAEEARTQKIRRHSQATVPSLDDQEDNSKNENESEKSKKTPKPPSRKSSNIPRYKGARATYTVQEMEKVQEKYNATEEEQTIKQKKGGKGKASGRPKYRPTETVEEEPEEPKKIRRLHDNDTSNPPRGRSPKRSSRRQTQRQNDGSPAKSSLSSSLLSPGKAATPRATTPRSRGASPSPRVQRIRQDVDGDTLAQLSKIKMLLRTQRDIAASAVQQNDVILHNRSRVMNSGRFGDSW